MDGTEEPALASGASVDELVPGSVEQILGLADEMSGLADGLRDAANALSRVEVTGWYGAASTAAHGRLGQEPSRWSAASGAFTTAGTALRRYAAALAPAREKAGQAVEAYRRYLDLVRVLEVATAGAIPSTGGTTAVPGSGQLTTSGPDRAELGHRATVLIAADQGRTDPAAVAVLGPLGTDLSGLAHSADALRRQAVALLAEARAQVVSAGDVAADAVQAAVADAPAARTFWQGTIRKPGAEGAGHAGLGILSWAKGPIGAAAVALDVAWYASEGDSESAGVAAASLFLPRSLNGALKGSRVGDDVAPLAHVPAGKWEYLFGRVTSSRTNQLRSIQNQQQLARVGIFDTDEGRQILEQHFTQVVETQGNVLKTFARHGETFEVRDSLLAGPRGFIHLETCWRVDPDGFTLVTIIPRGGT